MSKFWTYETPTMQVETNRGENIFLEHDEMEFRHWLGIYAPGFIAKLIFDWQGVTSARDIAETITVNGKVFVLDGRLKDSVMITAVATNGSILQKLTPRHTVIQGEVALFIRHMKGNERADDAQD